MLMDPRSSGLSVCLAAPSSRYTCAGGTDLAPSLGSPPRARWAPGAAVAPSRLSRSGRRAEAVQVLEIDPDLRPLARPDFSQSSSTTSSRCRRAARPGTPTPRGTAFGLGGRLGQSRNAWGNLSHADRIAKAVESSAEKRLPLLMCGGGARAGPTSGMRATATALHAGSSGLDSSFDW